MNEMTKELCHFGFGKGSERKNHKYFARIEGSRPGTYRYFYSMIDYNKWKNGARNAVKTWKSGAKDIRSEAKAKASEAVKTWKSGAKDVKSEATSFVSKYAPKTYSEVVSETIDQKTGIKTKVIEKGIEFLNKKIPLIKDKKMSAAFKVLGKFEKNGGTSHNSSGRALAAETRKLRNKLENIKKRISEYQNKSKHPELSYEDRNDIVSDLIAEYNDILDRLSSMTSVTTWFKEDPKSHGGSGSKW